MMARGTTGIGAFLVALFALFLGGWGRESPTETAPDDAAEAPGNKGNDQSSRVVEVGTALTSVTLTRIRRKPDELASRAATLASGIVGSECSPREAVDWAQEALSSRATIKIGKPFSCSPYIEASYLGYYDRLSVRDVRSSSPPPSQLVQAPTELGPAVGIGKSSARMVASQFVTQQLTPTGIVDDTWIMVDSRRLIDGMVDIAGGTSGSKVREYGFGYRRHVDGFPLIGSFLEISVDNAGVVRGVILADITTMVGAVGEQEAATRSESMARGLFQRLAEARAHGWSPDIDATVKRSQVGYVLPYDEESISSPPVLWGEILHKHGVIVSPTEDAILSLVDSNPKLVLLEPWAGTTAK